MKEIKLEIMRHGSSHNQLLSPLTAYLAVCENEPVSSLQIPLTHADVVRSSRALSYQYDELERQGAVHDAASKMAAILASIPGLMQQLGGTESAQHVRLILSAAELALLPFELAFLPQSLSHTSKHLLLQQNLVLTRETRRRVARTYDPNASARVLFAFADPQAAVPAAAHARALQQCIQPWLKNSSRPNQRELLRILPNASMASLVELCARERYTHVHLLAHGAPLTSEFDQRYGVVLHHAEEGFDVVDGPRLASALLSEGNADFLQSVSIASCDSGRQGGVIGLGGSVAQALHEAGIPMVIASQFPLSVAASIEMVRAVYQGIFWGLDPRCVISSLRKTLHAKFPHTHDWASVVHYLSSGTGLAQKVFEARVSAAMSAVHIGKEIADQVLLDPILSVVSPALDLRDGALPAGATRHLAALEKLGQARSQLQELLQAAIDPIQIARMHLRLGSTDQHVAQLQLHAFPGALGKTKARATLLSARQRFWDAHQQNPAKHWALLMYLSLHLIAKKYGWMVADLHGLVPISELIEQVRLLARAQGLLNSEDQAWANADLLELALVQKLHVEQTADVELHHAISQLKNSQGHYPFPMFAARRQALRYRDIYAKLGDNLALFQPILAWIDIVAAQLPFLEQPARPY